MTNAPLWEGILARNGKRFGFRYTMTGIDEQFRTLSGFISRPGIAHGAIDHRATWFNERGNLLETLTGDILFDDTWQYSHLMRRGDAQDKKFHVSTSAGLRGGWTLGAGVYWETFGYDTPALPATIASSARSARRSTPSRSSALAAFPTATTSLNLSTPQWSQFNASLLYIFGQDENFFEWAQADIDYVSLTANFRPTDQLRVNGTLSYQDYWRRTDNTMVGTERDSAREGRVPVHALDLPPCGRRVRSVRARRPARRDADVLPADHQRQEGAGDAQRAVPRATGCSRISRIRARCCSSVTAAWRTRRRIRSSDSTTSRSSGRRTTSS